MKYIAILFLLNNEDYSNQAHPYRLQPSLHVVKYLDDSNEFAKADDSYKLSRFSNQHASWFPYTY